MALHPFTLLFIPFPRRETTTTPAAEAAGNEALAQQIQALVKEGVASDVPLLIATGNQ